MAITVEGTLGLWLHLKGETPEERKVVHDFQRWLIEHKIFSAVSGVGYGGPGYFGAFYRSTDIVSISAHLDELGIVWTTEPF